MLGSLVVVGVVSATMLWPLAKAFASYAVDALVEPKRGE